MSKAYAEANARRKKQQEAQSQPKEQRYEQIAVQAVNSRNRERENAVREMQATSQRIADNDRTGAYQGTLTDQHRRVNDLNSLRNQLQNLRTNFGLDVGDTADLDEAIKQQTKFVSAFKNDGEYRTGYWFGEKYKGSTRKSAEEAIASLENGNDAQKGEALWLKQHQYQYWNKDELQSEMQSKRAELKELKDRVNSANGVGKSLAYERYGDRIDTLKSEITAMSQALDSAALENELKKFTATELEKFWQYGEERTKMDDYATASGNSPAASLALAEHQKKADSVGQMLKKKGYSDAQIKTLMDYSVKAANAKSVQSQAEMLGKLADSGFWGKVAATGVAVALDFESGIGAIDIAAQNLFRGENAFTGEKTSVDYNTRTQQFGLASEAAKSAVTKDMGEFGQWLYNTGLSAAESIIGAYGMPPGVYEVLMSGMAAQSAMQSMHRRGATDNQTVGVGLLAGLLEAVFEHASIENLRGIINAQKATGAGVKGFLQRSLLQAGVEASEEGFTSLANTAAELIFLQDKSELKSNINTYMQQGMTEEEATRKAGMEWLDSVLQDTAAGFASGGIATMPANGRIAVTDQYLGQRLQDSPVQTEFYLNAALAMDEKSPAYKVAKELEAEFEKGQNDKSEVKLSRTKLGELYRKVNQQVDEDSKSERAQIESQMPKTQEAVFINAETGDVAVGVKASRVAEALIASGESAKNAVAMAPVIEKIVAGETVTDAELKSMGVFSKAVADVVNTYTQSDIDPNNATEAELIKAYRAAATQQKTRIDDAAKMGEAIKEANAKLEAAKAEAEAQLAEQTAQVEAEAQAAIAEAEQSAPEQTQESAPSFRFTNGDVSQDLTTQDYIELVRKSNPNDARSDADLIEEFNSLLGHAAMNGGTIDAADVPNILREHRAATEATAKPKPKPKPKTEAAALTVDGIAETLNSGKRKVEGYTVYRHRDTQRTDGATITVKRPDGTNIKRRVENGRHMTNEQLNRIAAEIIADDMGLSTPATTPSTPEPKTEPKTEEPKAPAEEAKPESKEKVDRPLGEEIAKDIYFVAEEGNKVQKLSATQIRSLQLAMPVLRFAGVTKVIVDEKATQGTNAYIDEDTGIVRINPSELKSTWMIFWALGHEILHPATSDRNGQTNKMAERVIEAFEAMYSKGVLAGDLESMVKQYMNGQLLPNVKKQYSDFLGREVTDHYARQEIAGNMFGFIAESRPIMEKMAGYQPTLMTKVLRKLIAAREGITTAYVKDGDQRKATQAALDLLASDINKALRKSKLAAFQPKTKAQERADRRAEKQAAKTQKQNSERIEKVRERAKTADKGEPVAQSATPENKSVAKAMARLNKGAERTRSGRAALGIFPKGSTEHKAIEALGSGSEVITNGDDELVLAKSKDNHTVMYSLPTLFGTGRYYEEHPEAKSGIELLTQTLKDNGHSDDEIKEVIDGLTQAAQELMDLSDQIAEEYGWEGMREHLTMEIVTDIRDAQQVIYTLTPNGEYPVNLDLALVCKKRVAYTRILAQLVRDGVLDEVDFGSEAIAKVNQILRDSGFETACLGCFVEARRTAIQKWAEDFIYEWNKVVEEHDPNAGYFNFTYTTNPQTGERENTTPAISEKDVAALDRMYELNVLNKQGNVSLSSSTPLAKVEELFGKKMETGVLLKKLRPADLMTPEGIAAIKKTDKTLFNLVKARYGATQPKVLQEFHPYASDMANATFEEVARKTGKGIKGAETYREKAEEMLQREPNESDEAYEIRMRKLGVANLLDDADKQRRIDALAMRLYLYDIGGARIQSFSDFMIENTLDYLQIIADMSAARLPMHGYTKEIIAMKLFGMTGLKWNGSLIAHVDPSEDKNHAGLLPVSEASDGRGIVLTGPARVENGEIIGEKQWAICFDDYDRNERTSKPAKEYLAAHGGDEKKLSKTEAREYERLKRQASYIQSIGMKDIFALMMDPRYSKNIGNITIGVSDVQIIAMLRSDLFTMVIPYHKSGLPKIFAQLMGIENYNDYEPYQKTTVKQVFDAKGNPIDGFIRVGGKIVHADTEAFNFNAALQEHNGNARDAANDYLAWCGTMHEIKDSKGNTLGYETFNPKFSNSPNGYNFTQEYNYYKLLEDFTALDPVTGEWTPQGPVQQYEMNKDGTYDLTRSRLPSENNRLTDEQKAQYRERLRDIGVYTEAEIDKIIQKSDMTFAELVKAEAKNRGRYHHETDPRFDSTYKQIVEALTGKEYRGTRAERDAERQKKLDKKAEEKAKKAAAKAAAENAAGAQVGDGGIRFSLRTASPPKKTQYGFKLMDVDENGLPHAMFIDADKPYEFGVWYDADSPDLASLTKLEKGFAYEVDENGNIDQSTRVPVHWKSTVSKAGKKSTNLVGIPNVTMIRNSGAQGKRWMAVVEANDGKGHDGKGTAVYNIGINGSGSPYKYAIRPGLHAVDIPSMRHIGSVTKGSSKIDTRRPNQRWFLIEYPVDQDYNQEAYANPDKDIKDHLPTNGWYSYQTNSGAEAKQHWFITGAMKIVGPVSEADVREYARDHEMEEDLPWKNGKTYSEDDAIDLDEYIRTTDAQPTPSKEEMRRRIEESRNWGPVDESGNVRYSVSDIKTRNIVLRGIERRTMENDRFDRLRAAHGYDHLPRMGFAFTSHNIYVFENHSFMDYTLRAQIPLTEENKQLINEIMEEVTRGENEKPETFDSWLADLRRGKGRDRGNRLGSANRGRAVRADGLDGRAPGSNTGRYSGEVRGDSREPELNTAEAATSDNEDGAASPIRRSLPTNPVEMDRQYMDAVKSGDTELLQEMVRQAAERAGWRPKYLYHGTQSFGFTKFDLSKMDDGASIFLTDDIATAETYSGRPEVRRVSEAVLEAPDFSQMSVEELVDWHNKNFPYQPKYLALPLEEQEKLLRDYKKRAYQVIDDAEKLVRDPQTVTKLLEAVGYNSSDIEAAMAFFESVANLKVFADLDDPQFWKRIADDYSIASDELYAKIRPRVNGSIPQQMINGFGLVNEPRQISRLMKAMERGAEMYWEGPHVSSHLYDFDTVYSLRGQLSAEVEAANETGAGNYQLFAKYADPLRIDVGSRNWDEIALPQEMRDERTIYNEKLEGLARAAEQEGDTEAAKQYREKMLDESRHYYNTREVSKFARALNFDSVVFEDIVDDGGEAHWGAGGLDPATIIIVFDAAAVKSADPITYDDEGKVIPLSERFNPENEDIRYSLPSDPVEMDRQYMDAVESGDMETAQRMVDEAARKAGYTTKAYHGTPNGTFNVFRGWQYFTESKDYADVYQNQGASSNGYKQTATRPRTYSVFLDLGKVFDTRNERERKIFENEFYRQWGNGAPLSERGLPDWTDGDDFVEFFEENEYDYDSILLDEGGTGGYGDEVKDRGISIAVKDPSQIKSADPVTYDDKGEIIPLSERFNPESDDIRFSLNPDLFLTEEYKTYYQELFSDKGLSPDAVKKARAAKRDEEISRIATTYKNFFDANERRRKGLRKGDLGYIPDTNSESMQRAEDRLDADFQGEYESLKKNGLNTDDDVDTAMGILAVLVADARTTKDYKTVADWLQRIRANATRAGQTVQAFAKYAQTPEGILVDAAEILAETDLSKADQGIILGQLAEFAKTLNAIKKGEEGNRDDLIDLILQQAEMRNTKVSNQTLKDLYRQKIDFLYDAALNQMSQIAQDYLKPSLAKGMATYQTISHLFNVRTAARNVVSNTVFSPVAAVANNLAVVPDLIIGAFTHQNTVGLDRWIFDRKTWKGMFEGARRAHVEIALDIDPRPNSRDKYGTSRRTWKMTGNAASRVGSTIEKAMGFELNWTDEFHKGAVEAEILQSLQGLVDKGVIREEDAKEWARQEALYRSFQDDTFLSARLQDIKNLLNTVGFGHTGRYLGAKAQTPFNEIKEFGLGDLIQKYTQVPGALITRAVEFSPIGYVKMIANLAQMKSVNKALRTAEMRLQEAQDELDQEPDSAALLNRVFQAQKSVDSARFKAQNKQRMAALAMGRATTGVGLIKAFAMLAASGLLHRPDDDDDPDATAMLQSMGVTGTQLNVSALARRLKGEPVSWQKGDQLWAIDFLEPLNGLMTIGVKIIKEAKDDKTFKDKLDSAQRGTLDGLWNVIGEIPTMQSLGTIQQTLRYYDPEQWPNRATAVGIELARGSATGFVPSVVRQTAQATDTVQRNTYTSKSALQMTKDQIQNTLPYFRNKLPAKLDNFGNPRKLENPLLNALNAYVIPGSIRTYQVSPEAQELVKVSGETGDVNIFPDRNAPSTVKISVEGQDYSYDLTAQQKQAYQAARGKYTYQFQHDMMRDPFYKGATTQEKNKMLTEAKQLGDYMAKKEFLAKQKGAPAYSDSAKEKTLKALGAGYTVASWVDVRDTANKAKGVDADGDGKTDSGSKKKAQLEIIQGLNLTDQQKTFWFRGSDYNGTDDGKDKIGDAANMSIAPTTYIDAVLKLADAHGVDDNGDGKTDSGSKMRNEADIINSLPLTIDQKRWLFFQLHETSTKFEAGYTWYDTSGN